MAGGLKFMGAGGLSGETPCHVCGRAARELVRLGNVPLILDDGRVVCGFCAEDDPDRAFGPPDPEK